MGSSVEIAQILNDKYFARNNLPLMSKNSPVLNVQINSEKNYAFIDCSGPEHATEFLAYMDGVILNNRIIRIKRPKDYSIPPEGDPVTEIRNKIDRSSFTPQLTLGTQNEVADGPQKLFLGNISRTLQRHEILNCLRAIGNVKSFTLVMERDNSELNKGYAFIKFKDAEILDEALLTLKGLRIERSSWIVDRHVKSLDRTCKFDYSIPKSSKNALQKATKVIELSGIIEDPLMLIDFEYFRQVQEDVEKECERFGRLKSIHIPKPNYYLDYNKEITKKDKRESRPILINNYNKNKH